MHLRRTPALLICLLALATLTGCREDMTNQINQISHGTVSRETDVDVLGAIIVSAEDGSGTFVATFVNNSTEEDASVESVAGADDAQGLTFQDSSVDLAPSGMVNLATDGGFEVEGDFVAGDFVPLTVTFGDGESVDIDVPVVTNCGMYADLDGPSSPEQCEAPETLPHSEGE